MIRLPEREETLTNVPAEEADEIAHSFKLDGAVAVLQSRQPDGRWTVTARFLAEPRPARELPRVAAE